VNNELKSIWKETVVALFELLSRHLSEGTKKTHKETSQDSQYPGRDSNRATPEYEPEPLLVHSKCISFLNVAADCI
jgi:hypothetical protein